MKQRKIRLFEHFDNLVFAKKHGKHLKERAILTRKKKQNRSSRRKDFLVTEQQAEQLQEIKAMQGLSYSSVVRRTIKHFIFTNSLFKRVENFAPYSKRLSTNEPLSKMRVSVTLEPHDMKVLDAIVKKYKVSYSDVIRFALGKPLQASLDNSWKKPLLKKGA